METPIHIRACLSCPPEEAFRQFVDPERLESWLTELAKVEPELGGRYELFWDLENLEQDNTVGCKFTVFEPGRLLAFDWTGPVQYADFMNVADPLTHVTVSIHPGQQDTEVHLVHTGWRSAPQWQEARQYFERAWTGALQNLESQINQPS